MASRVKIQQEQFSHTCDRCVYFYRYYCIFWCFSDRAS